MFLCPSCGRLSERLIAYETQIWSYWYYVDSGSFEDGEFEETADSRYRCPDCSEEVDPDYYLIDVNEDRRVYNLVENTYWTEHPEEAREIMVNRYGYVPEDEELGWGDQDEEDFGDFEEVDIFIDQNEIWEV